MRRFNLGLTVMTRGIQKSIEDEELTIEEALNMIDLHLKNESDICEDDKQINEEVIQYKEGRVFSSFNIRNFKIYVITERLEFEEKDIVTTILFANEY